MLPLINDDENIIHQHSQQQQHQQQHSSLNSNKSMTKLLQMKMATTTSADAAATATATMAAHTDNGGALLMKQMSIQQHQQHQQFHTNNHIIENFIESVREMNDVVLIPSKLMDLEPKPSSSISNNNSTILNDDLYSYYQMINIIKNDLFDTSHRQQQYPMMNDSNNLFKVPKRKISRHQQHQQQQQQQQQQNHNCNNNHGHGIERSCHSRSVSSTNLASMYHGNGNGINNETRINYQTQLSQTSSNNGHSSPVSASSSDNGIEMNDNTATMMMMMNSTTTTMNECHNARQLTIQFIHHLHSLYSILEHFTQAADIITERYTQEFEQSI
ncbi:hypothetical protein DERF_011808 [Dermatophagoides farinae]|uniref:Uncharacterized protein n=1 Tax=Dermatophagoides farinae TaxID=6954 RepID=A0A922HTT9_DERFA|nr:hypothetical protein DERF_011808 [Dermatophagoides farinae]